MKWGCRWSGRVLNSLLLVAMAAHIAHAQQQEASKGLLQRADANIRGISPAGAAAPETGEAGSAGAPVIVDGHSFAGQRAGNPTGAIGPFSYIQLTAQSATIYNRHTHAVIASGTLNQLGGDVGGATEAQIIWDANTNRFYYAMAARMAFPRISFGFSKTPHPTTISSADWCHYGLSMWSMKGAVDSTKLGDNKDFLIIGFHHYVTSFSGAKIFAVAKPPAGTTCPDAATLKSSTVGARASGGSVWAPIPSNQVDDQRVGHVVARTLSLPSNKLWFFTVSKGTDGYPVIGPGRALTVPSYALPPAAAQPSSIRRLNTGDGRPSPAVQAINPARRTNSFWLTQTVKHATEERSVVRWYEVDPAPLAPVLLRTGVIGNNTPGTFFFNAAISPDRRKDGATAQYGDSFVIQYNVSSSTIHPGIAAASSFKGGAVEISTVKNGVGPYRDYTCKDPGSVCAWGRYSSAVPDPRPSSVGSGVVWGTNQFSGTRTLQPDAANFRTWIFAVQP